MTTNAELLKEHQELCEKKFVSKPWMYGRLAALVGIAFGLIWGASAWQTKTEMRIGAVEMTGTENKTDIMSLRHDVDKLQTMNSKLDTIVKMLRNDK